MPRTALIIGAGPAGLTAAYELSHRTDIRPIVLEATGDIGGISKTVNYRGNRIDIGGHRFFSKSDRIMQWWQRILPLQGAPARDDLALGRRVALSPLAGAPNPETEDRVLLARSRVSRILYERRFYDYPVGLSPLTVRNLGLLRMARIVASYGKARIRPIRPERSLEDFFVNRFGRELYATFFRDYTEKVWGVPCARISPEWGGQRVKGLSVGRALLDGVKGIVSRDRSLAQKGTETSLIRQFLYPKLGPGQMWEEVARIVQTRGGEIRLHHEVVTLAADGARIRSLGVRDVRTGQVGALSGDIVLSSMPVRDLVSGLRADIPAEVKRIAGGLVYRDFVTVGLLLRRLLVRNSGRMKTLNDIIPDTWIYVQESDVRLGRIQVFNNWSPYLVADPRTVWLGLEYFCTEGDDFWRLADEEIATRAVAEMCSLGFADRRDVLDTVVVRMPKTYPAYFGTYGEFETVKACLDGFENLFLLGRNGMHRYNNQDHSMLTAMTAVDNLIAGHSCKDNIWSTNTEEEYHEER
ncbi:MAG: NAD(P)/FAD-dependent oxidoreductase [Candidatus Eisenbacteria bacterium]|jgi:protoporphyrinogen oxidase|nr:NAD(P)/FAD-dependent oxidoreductase [Candidatus Eisenbacteria bacterium]